MKYKLGDFVRFVDEKMEGFVTRIIDEQMIGVTGDDDFEILRHRCNSRADCEGIEIG